VEWLIGNVAVK